MRTLTDLYPVPSLPDFGLHVSLCCLRSFFSPLLLAVPEFVGNRRWSYRDDGALLPGRPWGTSPCLEQPLVRPRPSYLCPPNAGNANLLDTNAGSIMKDPKDTPYITKHTTSPRLT